MRRKFITLLLAIVMVVMLLPMTVVPVFAEESGTTEKNISLGTTALQGAQKSNVYYGTYKQSSDGNNGFNVDPIKWRVLSNSDDNLFLLADQSLDVFQYNTKRVAVTWETSTMRSWLNGYEASKNRQNTDYTSDNFIKTAFSTQELAYILQTTLENAGNNNTDDYIFLLSIAEATNTAYGFTKSTSYSATRASTNTAYVAAGGKLGTNKMKGVGEADYWWLRSPGNKSNQAKAILPSGYVNVDGNNVDVDNDAVRPAFNLNLSSVLFTSAAKSGKSSISANAEIGNLTDNDGYKLTLLDASRSGFSAKILKTADKTYVEYQGATTGTNEYITAMIVNAGGEVTYYGSLKNITESTDANRTIEIDLSGKLNDGDKVYILNEQWNGDYKTDYASALNEVTVPTDVNAYYVSFNANGSTGMMDDAVGGDSYTLPKCGFTYVGYSFKGWSYTADGEVIGTTSVEITNDTTLYAIWISNSDLIAQLDKTIKDLDTAIANGNANLSTEISDLNTALTNAQNALEATDSANKSELENKISTAQTTLQAAIDKVSQDLENAKSELTQKDAELQTFIIITCVLSCVTFCGFGAFAIWFFFDRKKNRK